MAGSFGISPIRVELTARHPTTVIQVENRSTEVRDYQVEPVSWKQASGLDEYSSTANLIVVPPRFRLRPGATQTVRIGTHLGAAAVEQTFRLFIQELPIPAASAEGPGTVQTLLRVGIPIFYEPIAPQARQSATQRITAQVVAKQDGSAAVVFDNRSAFHIQLQRLVLTGLESLDLNRYILPGQQSIVPLPRGIPPEYTHLELEVWTDQGRIHVPSMRVERVP